VIILVIVGVALIGASAALVARALALPRLRAMDRLDQIEAYGFSGPAAPVRSPRALSGALEGVAKSLGSFVSGRLHGFSEAEMRRELMAAGMYRTTPVTLLGYRVISAASFPATGLWVASTAGLGGGAAVLTVIVMIAVGWLAPMTIVRRRARLRLERLDRDLPELVDLLVVTVESGLGFTSSMQLAAERFSGPLGDELRLAMQEQAMGLPTDQVLSNILTRSETPSMRSFVRSVRQGEALGVSIGQIMRSLAAEMRKRRAATAEERAQRAPVKILFPLVALIFPALFVVLLAPALISFLDALGGS
jgi:tight adherence protein C